MKNKKNKKPVGIKNRKDKKPDIILIVVSLILLILGILILASVSAPLAQRRIGNPYYFLKHQILFAVLPGLFFCFIAYKIEIKMLKKAAPFLFLVNLVLMLAVFLPKIGISTGGATRWLKIGPFSFQPSEFLKLSSIIYFSSLISSKRKKSFEQNKEQLIVFLSLLGAISLILILQPDISTLGIISLTLFLIYFLSGTPLLYNLIIGFSGIIILLGLIKLAPYRMARLLVFLNPKTDPMGIGYQIKQALIAVGSGGVKGSGLGLGFQKLGYLPGAISDSIFALFAEEVGLIGALILISLFLLFMWRGYKISLRWKESTDFPRLVSLGIVLWIVIQAFINIGAMIRILPLTGVPLPFISYGGSALVTELIGLGILLNISKK